MDITFPLKLKILRATAHLSSAYGMTALCPDAQNTFLFFTSIHCGTWSIKFDCSQCTGHLVHSHSPRRPTPQGQRECCQHRHCHHPLMVSKQRRHPDTPVMYKNSRSVLLSPAGAAELLKVKRHLWPHHLYPDPNPGPGMPYSAVAGMQHWVFWAGLPVPTSSC